VAAIEEATPIFAESHALGVRTRSASGAPARMTSGTSGAIANDDDERYRQRADAESGDMRRARILSIHRCHL
jgi:hypothetical protein